MAGPWRAACLGNIALTLTVTAAVLADGLLWGEVAFRNAILIAASPLVLRIVDWVSIGGTWRVLIPATLVLLVLSGKVRRRWWLWGAVLVGAPLIGEGWQELVRRTRPHGSALGFPSGHATAVAAFAVMVIYLAGRSQLSRGWRLGITVFAGAAACAVGLARILLQAHWPADVLGGFAIGAGCAAGGAWWDAAHGAARTALDRAPRRALPSGSDVPRRRVGSAFRVERGAPALATVASELEIGPLAGHADRHEADPGPVVEPVAEESETIDAKPERRQDDEEETSTVADVASRHLLRIPRLASAPESRSLGDMDDHPD